MLQLVRVNGSAYRYHVVNDEGLPNEPLTAFVEEQGNAWPTDRPHYKPKTPPHTSSTKLGLLTISAGYDARS